MSQSFSRLSKRLQQGIIDKLGWKSLRGVQEDTIPAILDGNNAIIQAATAGGKTEAAFLPILSIIHEEGLAPLSAIYISPIRALLNNQEYRLKKLGSLIGVEAFKWHGEVYSGDKKHFKNDPEHILATTPESLEVLLMNGSKPCSSLFENMRFIVIDEIHYFAGNDRGIQLMSIIERIQQYSRFDIQRIGLSATIGNPSDLLNWMQGSSNRNQSWIQPDSNSKRKTKLFVRHIDDWSDEELSRKVIPVVKQQKSLFFADSRSIAEKIANTINDLGVKSRLHHSSISKVQREQTETLLQRESELMVSCTSTMELGIDVGDLDVILQYNAPNTVSSFLQRLGRTGRREGRAAHYEFLTVNKEALLRSISLIELAREKWVESVRFSTKSYHVLIQQIFSTVKENQGASLKQLMNLLKERINFSNISESNFLQFLHELVKNNYLLIVDGIYFLSDELEERFARKNFLDLCSVFETAKEFTVKYQNREIGTLDSWFIQVYYKENEPFLFVLNGNVWKALELDKYRFIIHVIEAEKGAIPVWQGTSQKTSYDIARKILKVLSSHDNYPYIDHNASQRLKEYRTDFQYFGMKPGNIVIEEESKGFTLHTFAGDEANFTFATLLKHYTGAEVKSNYQNVKFKLEGYSYIHLERIIEEIKTNISEENLLELRKYVGDVQIAKFQKFLPQFAEANFLSEQLFNLKLLKDFLNQSVIEKRSL
jgi:ATP-dependent helicase Lhr and Lhr-like helicase